MLAMPVGAIVKKVVQLAQTDLGCVELLAAREREQVRVAPRVHREDVLVMLGMEEEFVVRGAHEIPPASTCGAGVGAHRGIAGSETLACTTISNWGGVPAGEGLHRRSRTQGSAPRVIAVLLSRTRPRRRLPSATTTARPAPRTARVAGSAGGSGGTGGSEGRTAALSPSLLLS